LTLGAPPGTELGSGDESLDAAISPNERLIVFVATSGGTTALWRRTLDSERAEVMPGTERAQLPTWSHSGDAVSFFADGHLRTFSLTKGTVSDLADAASPRGATWLADGSVLFAPQAQGVIKKLLNGTISDATALRPTDRAHVFPTNAGVDGSFVYTAVGQDGRRMVRLVRNGEEEDLSATSGHGQLVGDYLLHVRDNVLLAQRLDEGTGRLQGRGLPISTSVGITSAGRSLFVASARVLLSAASSPRGRELAWFDLDGQRTGTTGESGEFWQLRLSPDDQYAAVTQVAPLLRTLDIALIPTGRGKTLEPLTLALAADSDPVWAPDGGRVLFRSLQKGQPMLFSKRAHDKGAEDEPLLDADATATDWRGSTVLFHAPDPTSGDDIWTVDMRSQARTAAVKSSFNDSEARWSPDGRWLAYVSDESGRPDVYAKAWPAGERIRVSSSGGTRPRWSRDGRSLLYLRESAIVRATLQQGTPSRFESAVAVLDVPGMRDFDVAHQRDALVALVPVSPTSSTPVSVLVDWQSTLPTVP
jgi:Tol biopolymer transport system component